MSGRVTYMQHVHVMCVMKLWTKPTTNVLSGDMIRLRNKLHFTISTTPETTYKYIILPMYESSLFIAKYFTFSINQPRECKDNTQVLYNITYVWCMNLAYSLQNISPSRPTSENAKTTHMHTHPPMACSLGPLQAVEAALLTLSTTCRETVGRVKTV